MTPGAPHTGIVAAPEIFDPATNTWTTVTGANLRLPLYPNLYVLPDGRIFAATTAEEAIASRVLDLTTRRGASSTATSATAAALSCTCRGRS